MELIKNNNADINGTSFFNTIFLAKKSEIVKAFGAPSYECGDIDDKVQNEWDFDYIDKENDIESVVTIYDWKEYREYGDEEMIEWHIGGFNGSETGEAKEFILNKLGKQ